MATTSDFRNGLVINLDGELFTIVYFQHVKPGKGGAFVRTKLKNVKTGRVLDRTFRSGEKVEDVRLERKHVQFLYNDGSQFVFMDTNSYEQIFFTVWAWSWSNCPPCGKGWTIWKSWSPILLTNSMTGWEPI